MDLMQELQQKLHLLDNAIKNIKSRGAAFANSEKDYRVKLAQKILIYRAEGNAVSIISDVCRGDEEVADLKLKRDIAESEYKSILESIQVLKLSIRVIESAIDREYRG